MQIDIPLSEMHSLPLIARAMVNAAFLWVQGTALIRNSTYMFFKEIFNRFSRVKRYGN